MSMHLCGPGLTTTSYKKRKEKVTKAQQAELEQGWRSRNQRLKEMHLPKETFEQYLEWVYGKGKKTKSQTNTGDGITKTSPTAPTDSKSAVSPVPRNTDKCENHQDTGVQEQVVAQRQSTEVAPGIPGHGRIWVTGPCSSKPSPTYTGTKIIGIGTMHKSNAVPIFSDDEAKEISSMRR